MTAVTRRSGNDISDTVRIEACLARFRVNADAALDDLAGLIYERFRRLTAHILNQQYPVLHGHTDDAWHEAFLKIRTALRNEKVLLHSKAELCALAAMHIRLALTTMVKRVRHEARHLRLDDIAGADSRLPELAIDHSTFDAGRLDAWTEFHETVQQLSAELREVVDHLYYNGLSQQETADILSLPLTTVQWRWRAAKIALALANTSGVPV